MRKWTDNPLLATMCNAVLYMKLAVKGDRISLPSFWLPDSLSSLLVPSTQDPDMWASLQETLVITVTPQPPLTSSSLCPLVSLCPWDHVMLREPGSYTILHSVTLQYPVACRPPGRMASLLKYTSVILLELRKHSSPSVQLLPETLWWALISFSSCP